MARYACPNDPTHKKFCGTGSALIDIEFDEDGSHVEATYTHYHIDGPFDNEPEDITCAVCDADAVRL